jgi:TonB family protein
MGLVTVLAVSVLGSAVAAAAQQGGDGEQSLRGLVVDTSAVSPPLRVRHGSVDPDKLREVVSSQRAELLSCYERGRLENPNLSGTWTIRIVITGNGAVGTASIQGSTLHWLSMERCLLQLVRTWRFPPPADGKTSAVDYPFTFRKEGPDAGS